VKSRAPDSDKVLLDSEGGPILQKAIRHFLIVGQFFDGERIDFPARQKKQRDYCGQT
jgi:hypothetical protein